mmetsp:Transcript_58971/g.93817  ORF Transcript_58971/g.93817 Transcript_58971/m.93817 type:complete len:249 (+) Transcript_58971:113-859(+)|eukprot:CAMPEP_0197020660 /NCGR_PEP_ID=MMETSP1384-20130603/1502_1 /TAXON_ID=29189 /ORGANISM="Ammonia sp." /LENGTH=248 /DNA_ID=CAMNT_0042448331 /DNA_START=96 /DNA_END=842 /DNA_ORIENTATION=+
MAALSRLGVAKSSRVLLQSSTAILLPSQSSRLATFNGVYLGPGACDIDLDDGGKKPDGVPDTWTATDIWTDYGRFDEDTFPAALEGETLEQYCRRVPNIWSPCSNATDVVDINVYFDVAWAQDRGPTTIGMLEEPLIKIPPESADWHVTYQLDYEGILREMMFRTRPFPVRVTDQEFQVMVDKFTEGVKTRGVDYHFTARSFHEFWQELTGEDLKSIANVPTWEEEVESRIANAKARLAQQKTESIQQ